MENHSRFYKGGAFKVPRSKGLTFVQGKECWHISGALRGFILSRANLDSEEDEGARRSSVLWMFAFTPTACLRTNVSFSRAG